MKQLLIIAAVLALISVPVMSQECGPGCPACSGSGSNSGNLLATGTLSLNYLFIPDGEEETGILNLRAGTTSWMDAGIGYAFKADKAVWNLRMQPVSEDESGWRTAVIIGTGSVQTGGSDQSLYLQAAKTFKLSEVSKILLSTGVASVMTH